MKPNVAPNKVQAKILKQLFLSDGLRFAELNTTKLSNDHFSYHVRKLTQDDVIYKDEDGRYRLTTRGKNTAILLDINNDMFIQQGFIACRVVLSREINDKVEYLMQRRTKVPFRGYLAEPGGKIMRGESVVESAKRNMFEQTGLDCELSLKGQIHIRDYFEGELVQDKYFHVLKVENYTGKLTDRGPTGDNLWLTNKQIKNDPKAHQGIGEIINITKSTEYTFVEKEHTTHEY